ncbi:MAG: potassium channel protein [Desulfuromonadaceae bacterium]|nr:potassium channel protein [Desulfuromonadaceae bacterium]
MDPARHLKISFFVLLMLISGGTFGYMSIEGWRLLDAVYMTVITLGTVGFKEVHDLSDGGKLFTMSLIVVGVSVLGYIVGSLAQIMFEGQIQRIMGRKKVEKQIEALTGHYIICGFGRIGSLICKEFKSNGLKFVIIEKNPEAAERLQEEGYLFMKGDATLDETLLKGGINRAKGLISVVTSDTENVYITLTARGLNPDLYIMSRSGEEGSDIKLKRAGANKVVSPYTIGGNRMAQSILRPNVVDFIEIATGHEHLELQMEEINIPSHSAFVGETLVSSGFRKEIGVIIVGIKKSHGKMVFNPHSQTKIEEHDTLIVLGDPNSIHKLEDLVARTAMDEKIKEHRKEHGK